jgi:hypothetical protein
MAADQIRYDLLTQKALRGMVRDLLIDIGRRGLPGEHHFFIAFNTLHEGVKLSQRMRAQYPEEMTIVLQHQFWDLTVDDERFEVGLSFNGIPERLTIPFAAIKGFFDPSVQFGLQFEEQTEEDAVDPAAAAKSGAPAKAARPSMPELPFPTTATAPKTPAPAPAATATPPAEEKTGGGEVVRLDRFRKK